jgi:hypothetical protein
MATGQLLPAYPLVLLASRSRAAGAGIIALLSLDSAPDPIMPYFLIFTQARSHIKLSA